MRDEAFRRVRAAAQDAASNDDMVRDGFDMPFDSDPPHPLDETTLDEAASTQLGEMWDARRRDAS